MKKNLLEACRKAKLYPACCCYTKHHMLTPYKQGCTKGGRVDMWITYICFSPSFLFDVSIWCFPSSVWMSAVKLFLHEPHSWSRREIGGRQLVTMMKIVHAGDKQCHQSYVPKNVKYFYIWLGRCECLPPPRRRGRQEEHAAYFPYDEE